MKAIRCDLPFAEQIEIDPMGDLHIGDSMCDYKAIMERIERIQKRRTFIAHLAAI